LRALYRNIWPHDKGGEKNKQGRFKRKKIIQTSLRVVENYTTTNQKSKAIPFGRLGVGDNVQEGKRPDFKRTSLEGNEGGVFGW